MTYMVVHGHPCDPYVQVDMFFNPLDRLWKDFDPKPDEQYSPPYPVEFDTMEEFYVWAVDLAIHPEHAWWGIETYPVSSKEAIPDGWSKTVEEFDPSITLSGFLDTRTGSGIDAILPFGGKLHIVRNGYPDRGRAFELTEEGSLSFYKVYSDTRYPSRRNTAKKRLLKMLPDDGWRLALPMFHKHRDVGTGYVVESGQLLDFRAMRRGYQEWLDEIKALAAEPREYWGDDEDDEEEEEF